jgi:hypothetical protein
MTLKTKKFYLNEAQRYVHHIAPRNLTAIASRRFGKSEGIIMPGLLRNVQAMPRSNGGIVGANYKQLLTRTLPATFHALTRLGFKQNVHYFVGRKAPQSAGFNEPYIKPLNWDYFVHWYNGSVNALISQDIPYSSNSLTLDYLIVDEARTINHEKFQNETIPANSGLQYFKEIPWHTGITKVSDMPVKKSEQWILDDKQHMDTDLLMFIEGMLYQIYEQSLLTPSSKSKAKIKLLNKDIDRYRKELTLFVVYNILDNLEIVGERYVNDQFRNLTRFQFLTAILSQHIKNTEGGFYAALNDKLHYYTAYDNSYLNEFRTPYGDIDWQSAKEQSFDCKQDTDININKPLCIAFDTNININWLVCGQADYDANKLLTLKSFYVKHPRMLTELCNAFADYYEPLPNKEVVFYYDHTFLQGRSSISTESFYQTISRVLDARGWYVTEKYIGQAMKHD